MASMQWARAATAASTAASAGRRMRVPIPTTATASRGFSQALRQPDDFLADASLLTHEGSHFDASLLLQLLQTEALHPCLHEIERARSGRAEQAAKTTISVHLNAC